MPDENSYDDFTVSRWLSAELGSVSGTITAVTVVSAVTAALVDIN